METLDISTRAGYGLRVYVTQKQRGVMNAMTKLDKKVNVMVCSDGDGIPNETIPGMMKLKKMPLLDYIPAGFANDFITSLGIPKRIPLVAQDIVEGTPLAIDTGTFCEDRNFIYIAAFGVFTEVSYLTFQNRENFLGHQAYMPEGVKSLVRLRPYHMKAEWGGQMLEENFAFGMVTNTISVGGFKGLMNQSVALGDGLFEILLIQMSRIPTGSNNIVSYMLLREEPNEYMHKFRTPPIRLTSGQEVDQVLDGGYGGSRTGVTIGNIREDMQILLRNHPEEEPGWKQIK